ncbi:MAG: phage GP46 family protein [Marinomonas foliarum]|uniref:phage GP46 family protein n=1 Tax=Marinomonas foliarum TaxID=491950 RepID=UPI003F9D8252
MMISLGISGETNAFDLLPASDDKLTWLNNAITISLFTDARASDDDALPDDSNDRRGYWGDIDLPEGVSLGSKLWTLDRSKIIPDTLNTMHDIVTDAVQWLIDDEHLLAINVTVERDTDNVNRVNFQLDCQLINGDWVSIFRSHEVQS